MATWASGGLGQLRRGAFPARAQLLQTSRELSAALALTSRLRLLLPPPRLQRLLRSSEARANFPAHRSPTAIRSSQSGGSLQNAMLLEIVAFARYMDSAG